MGTGARLSAVAGRAESASLQHVDGSERVSLLPLARFVLCAPASDPDDAPLVIIEWAEDLVERPTPGSALRRAVISRWLLEPARDDDRIVRAQLERAIRRFPDIDTWWAEQRRGWLAPPYRAAQGWRR